MGLGVIFTSDANFGNMVIPNDKDQLIVSTIIHKAMIEVDEDGATAAAATGNYKFVNSLCKILCILSKHSQNKKTFVLLN